MTPEAYRIARELAALLQSTPAVATVREVETKSLRRIRRRTRCLPDALYCDALPSPDDPLSWLNAHIPRQVPAFRADQQKLDRERVMWGPVIRAAAARYGGARRLKARRR